MKASMHACHALVYCLTCVLSGVASGSSPESLVITKATCAPAAIRRRRRNSNLCACRRRSGSADLEEGWMCDGDTIVPGEPEIGVTSFPNITLGTSFFNVTVFLPAAPARPAYYESTRFDWSSMIGDMRYGGYNFFPSNVWRQPHDPTWTESGVGLAAEFGCGDDGSQCGSGWGAYSAGATNGLLGYDDAGLGEAFLKIGVGKLLKGSCTPGVERCQTNENTYRFNSPYVFAEEPVWNVTQPDGESIEMTHSAVLGDQWGYSLRKLIRVNGSSVIVENELTNIGQQAFTTPHYSHNFLSTENFPIGLGWNLTLDLDVSSYEDPSWATPLHEYFEQIGPNELKGTAELAPDTKIKAMFSEEAARQSSTGEYAASFGGVVVNHTIQRASLPLYAYNLYIERYTLSPEPILMINLGPGQRTSWAHTLHFGDADLLV